MHAMKKTMLAAAAALGATAACAADVTVFFNFIYDLYSFIIFRTNNKDVFSNTQGCITLYNL